MQKSNGLTSTMSRHSKSSDTKLLTSLLYLRKYLNKTIWEVHKLHWRQKKKIELQFSMFCLWLYVSDFCSLTKQCTRITTLGASNCRNTLLQINRPELLCELSKWCPAGHIFSSGKSTDSLASASAACFWQKTRSSLELAQGKSLGPRVYFVRNLERASLC